MVEDIYYMWTFIKKKKEMTLLVLQDVLLLNEVSMR